MFTLDPHYLEGYAILQLILRNYQGTQAFPDFAVDSDRKFAHTVLDVDVQDYHITVEYNGRYGYIDIVCPRPLFKAVTVDLEDGFHDYEVRLKDVHLGTTHTKK